MKKFSFIFIIFILVVSISIIIIQMNHPADSAAAILEKAFDNAGARVVSSELYMQGRLDSRYAGSAQEQRLLSDLICGAGGNIRSQKPIFSSIDTDICTGFQTDYIISPNDSIHADILKENQKSGQERRVTVSLTSTSPEPGLENVSTELGKVFANYGMKHSLNLRITGYVGGELDKKGLKGLCDRILKNVGADRVEGIDDNGLISVSAFSPSIGNTVKINGKLINVNVAVRYNSYENKTYIWLATPVITTEY